MSLKSILVAASGGTASEGAVTLAMTLAKRFDAQLEALHIKIDPAQIVSLASDGFNMPLAGDWIDRLIEDGDELTAKTKATFAAMAERAGLAMASAKGKPATATWHEETGYAPTLIAQRARFFDLVVLGRSERVVDRPHSDTIEEALIHSGRPVLLAPSKAPTEFGQSIALGWNGSAEAVHALTGALPLLAKAKTVAVITIGDAPDESVMPLLDHLSSHGVSGRHVQVAPVKGVSVGEQLLATARDEGADLLAMGGFGHRPWRELMFGGATHDVVATSLLPVLLAH